MRRDILLFGVEKALYKGLLAQTQHLKCYASTLALSNECVDPRWDNVVSAYGRGCAPCVEDLNGKWAVPGDGYGPREDRMNAIKDYFNLKDNLLPVALISIGYPGEEKGIEDRYDENKVTWL